MVLIGAVTPRRNRPGGSLEAKLGRDTQHTGAGAARHAAATGKNRTQAVCAFRMARWGRGRRGRWWRGWRSWWWRRGCRRQGRGRLLLSPLFLPGVHTGGGAERTKRPGEGEPGQSAGDATAGWRVGKRAEQYRKAAGVHGLTSHSYDGGDYLVGAIVRAATSQGYWENY
jgi:hypothetical protein